MSFREARRCSLRLGTCLSALLFCAATQSALADSYRLQTVSTFTNRANFYGIDDAGDFTVQFGSVGNCGGVLNASSCYETFLMGGASGTFSTNLPALAWDNGVSCTPALSGFSIASGLCNGDHFLAAGTYALPNNTLLRGIWAGPNPNVFSDLVSQGSIDGDHMNALGDAVFIDGLDNSLIFAEDLSTTVTPEPSSLVLLGTGSLAFVGALTRRRPR